MWCSVGRCGRLPERHELVEPGGIDVRSTRTDTREASTKAVEAFGGVGGPAAGLCHQIMRTSAWVDEVGYISFKQDGANLLFQLVSSRYEHASGGVKFSV